MDTVLRQWTFVPQCSFYPESAGAGLPHGDAHGCPTQSLKLLPTNPGRNRQGDSPSSCITGKNMHDVKGVLERAEGGGPLPEAGLQAWVFAQSLTQRKSLKLSKSPLAWWKGL